MDHRSPAMKACIEACLTCYQTCLGEFSHHCLVAGGPHVEPEHVRLMLACAEMCRTSAHFMILGTALHKPTCGACAEVCTACAESCETVGGMEHCVSACRAVRNPAAAWPPERRGTRAPGVD